MAGRIAIVTYNGVIGISSGRFDNGRVIIYSGGDYSLFVKVMMLSSVAAGALELSQIHEGAEQKIAKIRRDLFNDIHEIDEVYVYLGNKAMESVMNLIRDLHRAGKKVHFVICECDIELKERFAESFSPPLPLIVSECGGQETCARLIRKLTGSNSE